MIPQRTRRGWEDETALEVNGHKFRFSSLCVKGLGNLRTSTEKGAAEDEIVGWHHQCDGINRHEFEQTLGDSEGQVSLACCSPRGCKKLDTT